VASQKDDHIEPKLGRSRAKGKSAEKFISRVLRAASKAGPVSRRGLSAKRGKGAECGRGQVVARLVGDRMSATSRRVAVKARLVNLRRAVKGSAIAHLKYIERDGVTPDGERGRAYDRDQKLADVGEFEKRGAKDRHQFRFIVSPEDAAEFGDLKSYTRDLMTQMERDLGTRLDWVAVDHWDTEHPHTHIVVRGVAYDGKDLIIARDYISHGMRVRASELMTRSLGPRTEHDIQASLSVQVTQERWTGLDATLGRLEDSHFIADRSLPGSSELIHRSLLVGRLERLKTMDLAERERAGWRMTPHWQETLRTMGERGDIIRTMQRAMGKERPEIAIVEPEHLRAPLVGRIVAKGFVDEIEDQPYLAIDGLDGRAHYVKIARRTDLATLPTDGIVEIQRAPQSRASDRTIASLVQDGIYRTDRHLELARSGDRAPLDPQTFVEGHVRRLEALRRAGHVQRVEEGVWRIPQDLVERGRLFDVERSGEVAVTLHSHLSIDGQTEVMGATWLDRQLLGSRIDMPATPFGAALKVALAERETFLLEQGLAQRVGDRVVFARDLLQTLQSRELDGAMRDIERDTGLVSRDLADGARVSGIYRRSLQLASGRFAMLDDGVGFSLVPWRPVLESRLGEHVSATLKGSSISWELGRRRGLSR
jgi:type IV secretory pathway VirD2 relaxase